MMRGWAVLSVLAMGLGIAMAQSSGSLLENPSFFGGASGWKLRGGATYDGSGDRVWLPRTGARVLQTVNVDKGARLTLHIGFLGTVGYIRIRALQAGVVLVDERREVSGSSLQHVTASINSSFRNKPVWVVISAIAKGGRCDVYLDSASLTVLAFNSPLVGGEYFRNARCDNAASTDSWRLLGGASYSDVVVYAGSGSINLRSTADMYQSFQLPRGSYVLSCKARGKTKLMELGLGSRTSTDERLHFIDETTSPWKRWAKLYDLNSEVNFVEASLSSVATNGFGYADDCSLRSYVKEPLAGSVVGSVGPVFAAPVAGNQWIRNGNLESGFADWNAYVREPYGGFDDGFGDEIALSLFHENDGPQSGVFSAFLIAQVYLYQRFELPANTNFVLICEVTDSSQRARVYFLKDGADDADQVLGYGRRSGRNRFGRMKARFEFTTEADAGVYSAGVSQGLESRGSVDNCILKQI